ncbi:hypothetical protein Bbelb_285250 [Branchiostoma belcheri]|nr:hypothetical protein Bbelb_285250 [Branchiostoma belcheri]
MKGTLTLMLVLVTMLALMLDDADAQDDGGSRGRLARVHGTGDAQPPDSDPRGFVGGREPRDLAADAPQVNNEADPMKPPGGLAKLWKKP